MPRMELIAGDAREILVVLGAAEIGVAQTQDRYRAHLPMTGAIDPTWLDMFAEAARVSRNAETPLDFIDARLELGGAGEGALTVERVDPGWVTAVAGLPETSLDAIAGRWIDRLEDEIGPISGEEKPWIRELTAQLVTFCRAADREPDVVFVWSLR